MLRRVSSEEGVMGEIYKKIFRIEQMSDNASEASNDTMQLTNLLLIRKPSDQDLAQPKIILNTRTTNHMHAAHQPTETLTSHLQL